jgi:phage terminase large subunit-like protein
MAAQRLRDRSRRVKRTVIRYRPTVAQHHLEESVRLGKARISAMFGGIGSGKTCVGQRILYRAMTEWAPGGRFMIVTPSYKTFSQVTLPEIRKFWPEEGQLWRFHQPAGHPQIDAYWGDGTTSGASVCFVRSAQDLRTVEEVRGPTIAGIWGDEVGTWHTGRVAHDLAIGRLRMTDRDVPGVTWRNWWPRAWYTGSPRWGWLNKVFGIKGRMPQHAWTTGYYSLYRHRAPSPMTSFYVRACRTEANPYNAEGYAELLRAQYGAQFAAQELDGDFVTPTGAVFPHFYPDIHVIPASVAMQLYEACPIKVGGGDWGYGMPAALVAVGITRDHRVIVPRAWSKPGHTAQDMAAIAREWEKPISDGGFAIQRWHMDPEGGQGAKNVNIDHWAGRVRGSQGVNRPVRAANNAVEAGRNTLRNCMRLQQRVPHPTNSAHPGSWFYVSSDCASDYSEDSLVDDLQVLQYAEVAEGEEVDERKIKPKRATHRIAALRYGVHSELAGAQVRTSWQPNL